MQCRRLLAAAYLLVGQALAHSVTHLSENPVVPIPTDSNNHYLCVLVMSEASNVDARNAIRETWATMGNSTALVRFAIGLEGLPPSVLEELAVETAVHRDLALLTGTTDGYAKLTAKVLASMVWAERTSLQYAFFMKTDDNAFVRLDALQEELVKLPQTKLYWGYFAQHQQVYKEGKWAEFDWDLCRTYMPYALGGGYVLSHDVVQYLVQNGDSLRQWVSEDASIGAWLAPLELSRRHDVRFDTNSPNRGCMNRDLVVKKQNAGKMRELYSRLMNGQDLCELEHETNGDKTVFRVGSTENVVKVLHPLDHNEYQDH